MTSRKSRSQGFIWRFIFIFILSAVVVTLFWTHEELYQLGPGLLILITGSAMALITWLGVYVLSGRPVFRRGVAETLLFQPKEKEQVLQGKERLKVIPIGVQNPPEIDSLCKAGVVGDEDHFATLCINDVHRTLLGDLSGEDIRLTGHDTNETFRKDWTRTYGKYDPDQLVYLVRFDVQQED